MAVNLPIPVKPPAYVPADFASLIDTATSGSASPDSNVSPVNVTQFGWTSNDMTSVKDILVYVTTAQKAAEFADQQAQYIQTTMAGIDGKIAQFDTALNQIQVQYTQMQTLVNTVNTTSSAILGYKADVQAMVTIAQQAQSAVSDIFSQAKKYNLASVYKFKESNINTNSYTITTDAAVQRITLNTGVTTINLVENPAEDPSVARQLTLIFVQGTGSNSIKWSNNIRWNAGREPRLSFIEDYEDVVTVITVDKGKTWYGFSNGGWFPPTP